MAKYSSTANCKTKRYYATKESAKIAVTQAWEENQDELRVYKCGVCQGWHLTDIHYG